MWHVIHATAFTYPVQPTAADRQQYSQFLRSLGDVMCCKDCQRHFRQMLREFPPDFSSARALSEWTVDAHNRVNARLGKPEWSYKRAVQEYVSSTWALERLAVTGTDVDVGVTQGKTSGGLTGIAVFFACVVVGGGAWFAVTSRRSRSKTTRDNQVGL